MSSLSKERCTACRADSPKVSEAEMRALLPVIPEWSAEEEDGIPQLVRVFGFPNFRTALSFTDEIGRIAEEEGHHPAILTEWGRVTVRWWTHAIRGLHKNDFIIAAKTDALYRR